ncbi:MAG: hypothetical protein RQ751_06205 [Longimicrobiales bacterium]|nr:hypothetical protein [Longimicrobiales bacterium]
MTDPHRAFPRIRPRTAHQPVRAALFLPLLLLPGGCVGTRYAVESEPPLAQMTSDAAEPGVHTRVDSERNEVVMVAGPFTIPAGTMDHGSGASHGGHGAHMEGMKTPLVPLVWPVDGGLRGFRLGLFRPDGTRLPRDLIHHMNALHFDRRELIYPVATRLIAVGSETPDILLPESHQVRMARGDSVGWYIMWNNETGRAIEDVYVELALPYGEAPEPGHTPLTTLYFDTNLTVGEETSFDVPPGRSEKAHEFRVPVGGTILAAGGHVHDYGVEVRLEEVETGRVLFRLESDRDGEGRVSSVEQKIFRSFFGLFESGIRLEPGRSYRVVGVYDNPTGETIPMGGMAQIGGLFRPDTPARWPATDRTDAGYRLDRTGIPAPLHGHDAHGP